MSKLTQYLETMKERLDCAELYLEGDNSTTELGRIRAKEEVDALTFFIGVGKKLASPDRITDIIARELPVNYDGTEPGNWHILEKIAHSILTELTGEEKK